MDRIVRAHTPLGDDQLLFRSMRGSEGLSQLFEFDVELLSTDASIGAKSLLGKPLALEIRTAGAPRFLHGHVARFTVAGREGGRTRHTVYRAVVRPWLWYLTRTSNSRVFQGKSAVQIIAEVLDAYGFVFENRLCADYRAWDYCAQFNETDFAFVSRLMELEGIYYYFKHEKNQHTLVLADDISGHDELPDYACIDCFAADRPLEDDLEVIDAWQASAELRTGSYAVGDFNFTMPKADMFSARQLPIGASQDGHDMYEWMGDYAAPGQGEHYARVRLEEVQALSERSDGHATVRGMAPGWRFTMRGAPRDADNREYLLVSVSYDLREAGYASAEGRGRYSFGFVAQPAALPFRAPRGTPMPRATGPQTATVVGPDGQEIWTDEYGRVKLQFRWDRQGQSNQDSSAWVRVSQAWAGDGFGTVHVPRVGQEVMVDFIGGRVDRPIVIGRLYNTDRMPPFDLPAEATKSGIVSRSTPGGSPADANAIVFDDMMGAEQVLLHAQRNLDTEVEADEIHTTGGTRTTLIKGHESSTFESGEERHITKGALETIDGGETRTVTGGAIERVSDGETRTITGGAIETISGGERRTVTGGIDETVNGDVIVTVNGAVLRLVTGADIRITCAGRVEIVNAIDGKLVLGPDNTVVTGPKTVTAPDITYNSTTSEINVTNFKLNATVSAYNTPTQVMKGDTDNWWQRMMMEGTKRQALAYAWSFDRYGNKMQFSGVNWLIQSLFLNISGVNWLEAKYRPKLKALKRKKSVVTANAGGTESTSTGLENNT
ncbi:type VI secretion system tip protein VgrG [Variovorax gossypii]|uniref:Type VI secretion system tip protein VgrG n=1 Tax=Variovorax gossypii TaxID=1679495 RepID=A0A431TGN9_9BURK|nr:type VI secretion system tip protein TssI/VgrG [Variovorax gossypii]RTQ32591.1 type VI secretion system tip protein VgrG [Variovorax gossypii]